MRARTLPLLLTILFPSLEETPHIQWIPNKSLLNMWMYKYYSHHSRGEELSLMRLASLRALKQTLLSPPHKPPCCLNLTGGGDPTTQSVYPVTGNSDLGKVLFHLELTALSLCKITVSLSWTGPQVKILMPEHPAVPVCLRCHARGSI